MKVRLLRWFVFVLVVIAVGGEKSNSKDDEEDGYDIRNNNEQDEHDEATSRMLQLMNNAAMKLIDAPDLSKVNRSDFNVVPSL